MSTSQQPPSSLRRVTAASFVGTVVEHYDFLLYGFVAALVFGKLFFPAADPAVATIASFAAFGVGFIARPIGGIVAGHFGDRIGRKAMLIMTLLVAGVSTALMGLLPTYATIGVWAPIALVTLRVIQGFAYGGEVAGAVLMTAEHAPPARRGFYGSFIPAAGPAGLLLATLAILAVSALPARSFLSWGWRVPFLISFVLVVIGLFIRAKVMETPSFARLRETGSQARTPIVEVLRRHPGRVLLTAGAGLGFYVIFYVLLVFIASYTTTVLKLPPAVALTGVAIGSVVILIATPVVGAASDRIGRKPLILAGALILAAFVFPFFTMVNTGRPGVIYAAFALAFAGLAVYYGALATFAAELFPTRVRYSGSSLAAQLGAVLGGGLAPLIAAALMQAAGGDWRPVAWYICAALVLSVICTAMLHETKATDLDEQTAQVSEPAMA